MKAREAEREVQKFIQVITETRKNKNISHEKLAALTGLSRATISFTESGKSSPTLKTIFRICEALEIKTSELLRRIGR